MKKLGIIIDSFASITEENAQKLGYHLLPLQVEIDNVSIKDKTIENIELLHKIAQAKICKTSLPNITLIEQVLEKTLNKYDYVLFIGVSEHLSSTAQYIQTFAKNNPKLKIVKNNLVGVQIQKAIEIAQNIFEKTENIDLTLKKLQNFINQCSTYILPINLDYMIKGGRLTGIKKLILTKIKVFPILKYDHEGLVSVYTIKRTLNGAIEKLCYKVQENSNSLKNSVVQLISGIDEKINNKLKEVAKNIGLVISAKKLTPTAIAIHTGPDAICLSVMPEE
ncbi:DegV family protein [Mycoplasmopsis cricetuli]|uniref:DegV family protein n=1 Tax=Mycoplasmopsis cricetuli TaxID=171283 RepID=UPI00046F9296|nr:DegV family protein [Mycoplasmopsis cricetuli]